MKKLSVFIMVGISVCANLLGCIHSSAEFSGQELKSDKLRNTAPVVTNVDLDALVQGNNTFALSLFRLLSEESGNIFYSPYSISAALAMTWAGARGETERTMAEAMPFQLGQDRLHNTFNGLDLLLKQRGQGARGKDEKGFRLNVVNAVWGQKNFNFLESYLDVLAVNYGAGLRVVDFINKTEESRRIINNWVSEQTEDRIKDLIPQGAIDQETRLVLTNAVYFNAAWLYPFDKENTSSGVFNTLDGKQVEVPMMNRSGSYNYAEGEDYQAIELPYDGSEISMVIILPGPEKYIEVEKSLDYTRVKNIINNLNRAQVNLSMPRFEYEATLGLKDALSRLGMEVAFTEEADFSGIDGKRDLMIHDVLHKAFVSVDEAGTEATAATAVIVGLTSMPEKVVDVNINRPFVFFIRDVQTGSIIFLGRVVDPVLH